jgi:hypothetical protein
MNPVTASDFLSALLGSPQSVALRGVGEKGTDKFGRFSEPVLTPAHSAISHLARWSEHGIGAFVVPALVKPDNKSPHDDDVLAFTSLLVDLDDEALADKGAHYLESVLGPASIIVASSGKDSPKRHLYWLLEEPCEDTRMVAAARRHLAELVGGDAAFFRIPQIIRVPGTFNCKNDERRPVDLLKCDPDIRYALDDLLQAMGEAERPAWAPIPKRTTRATLDDAGRLNFTSDTASDGNAPAPTALTQDIAEGGGVDANRWSEFSRVAGHYIHALRQGQVATLDEARGLTKGWMLAHMKPAWPGDRFEREWAALVGRDIQARGPLVASKAVLSQGIAAAAWMEAAADGGAEESDDAPPPPAVIPDTNRLLGWSAARWTMGEKPTRKWIVLGLVAVRKSHLLVAEGGAGKTFAALELAMKVAAPRYGDKWLGQPIDQANCGTVVVLTAEDDRDEIHIRMADMDPDGSRRRTAGDRLIVIPLLEAGGAMRLVMRNKDTGEAVATPSYETALAWMKEIPDLRLVVFDTLASTMHGEENSAMVAQEWAYAAQRICSDCGAAYMALHHMRKSDRNRRKDAPPRTLDDIRDDIRGSNALIGALRMALVIWQPDDWAEQQEAMGWKPQRHKLWSFGVAKANNPEAMRGVRTLVRNHYGALVDAAAEVEKAKISAEERDVRRLAWAEWVIAQAAEGGRAVRRNGQHSIFKNIELQVEDLAGLSVRELQHSGADKGSEGKSIVERLIASGRVLDVDAGRLDVPHGALHERRVAPDDKQPWRIPHPGEWEFDADKAQIVRKK